MMKVKTMIIIMLCFNAALLQKHKHNLLKHILKTKSKFFYRINFNIHAVTNKLFHYLKINKVVRQSRNFKLLSTMHMYFNNIARENYRMYEEIRYASNSSLDIEQNIEPINITYLKKLNATVLSIILEIFETVSVKYTRSPNTYHHSYYITNKTEDVKVLDGIKVKKNLNKPVWSELSDKVIEHIIDQIIEENVGPNDTELVLVNISQELDTWRKLLRILSYFDTMAQKSSSVYQELNNISDLASRKNQKINLTDILQNIVKEQIDSLTNNITKLAKMGHKPKEINCLIANNQTSIIINKVAAKSNEKIMERFIDQIIKEYKNTSASEYMENISHDLELWRSPEPSAEFKSNYTRRIYEGNKTKIQNYPFLASVHLMGEFQCAGSIISMDVVLTAASCLQIAYNNRAYRNHSRTIFVRIGSDYTKSFGKLIPITKVIFHPNYDPKTLINNLAIVKTLKTLKYKMVKRIRYDKSSDVLNKDVQEITLLGWGAKHSNEKPLGFQGLSFSRLDVYDVKDCQRVYSKCYSTETNFCAGFSSRGSGNCKGDIGGPAIVEDELVGVISFGSTVCGMPDAPTVFTKVGYYAQWIDRVLRNKRKSKTTSLTPQVVTIPDYTATVSVSDNKHYSGRLVKDHGREMKILTNLIHELIISNDTVIDDLTNAQILSNDKRGMSTLKDKIFLDNNKYQHSKGHNIFRVDKRTRVTRPRIRIEVELTSTPTFIESNEFREPEESNQDVSSEKSGYSYYELEIPIKDTMFVKETNPKYKPTTT